MAYHMMIYKHDNVDENFTFIPGSWQSSDRIPTVKLKIPGKAFLKSESRTSVTFKL